MRFPDPLIRGHLVRRYKRFLSDIRLDCGTTVVAHCANPGSMLGLAEAGAVAWLSPSRNPKRKLKYSWELVERGGTLVGINTSWPNGIVAEAIDAARITELAGYSRLRREVPYGGNSRIDILLESEDRPPCYVEIKSVTLKRGANAGEFPDAVTKRGAKHIEALVDAKAGGARAVLLFLVQRGDCDRVTTADDIDPVYGACLRKGLKQGLEVLCYNCDVSPQGIELDRRLPFEPAAPDPQHPNSEV